MFDVSARAGAVFPVEGGLVLVLDGDGHAHVGEVLLQCDDVLIEQADATLAGASGDGTHAFLITLRSWRNTFPTQA